MHPNIHKRRTTALVLGWALVALGAVGVLLPFMQGVILALIGFSVLSMHVSFVRDLRVDLIARMPKLMARVVKLESALFSYVKLAAHTRVYEQVLNRSGKHLATIVEYTDLDMGTAILLHSVSGCKESATTALLADRCRERGFSVVRFDPVNGITSKSGQFTLFSTSDYLHDIEDMISWARQQSWYREPLILLGHSVGALVAGLYTAQHPGQVRELVLLAPTISGVRYCEAYERHDPEGLVAWRTSGLKTVRNPLTDEQVGLSYAFVEDLMHHSLVTGAQALSVPTFIIVGDHDRTTLVAHGQELAQAMGPNASLQTIAGLGHTPTELRQFKVLRMVLARWGSVNTEHHTEQP